MEANPFDEAGLGPYSRTRQKKRGKSLVVILRRRDFSRVTTSVEAVFLPGGWRSAQTVADLVGIDASQLEWQVNDCISCATGLRRFERVSAADGTLMIRAVEIPPE